MTPLAVDWKEKLEEKFSGSVNRLIGPIETSEISVPTEKGSTRVDSSDYICHSCNRYLKKGRMAPMSNQNNLQLVKIDNHPELQLSELENQLLARNLIFQKIKLLPKSRWNALIDKTVNVPIFESDVLQTVSRLPRTPAEGNLVPVQLKRRLKYPGIHHQEHVDVEKMLKALRTFKAWENRFYKFIPEEEDYRKRCHDADPKGFEFLFPSEVPEKGLEESMEYEDGKEIESDKKTDKSEENEHCKEKESDEENKKSEENEDDKEDEEEKAEKEYNEKDPVRKWQFNYNKSTCFSDNQPETRAEDNQSKDDEPVKVAPGEGKIPSNILEEKNWDVKSFPCHHPDGNNGKDEERPVKLQDHYYFVQRILNKDERFANDAAYIFAATAFIECKQMNRNINLAFQRGHEKKSEDGTCVYTLEDAYMVLDNIKNTPRYWKKGRYEQYARLENLGAFILFFTLSCADVRWPENFTSMLRGHDITYTNEYGQEQFYVDDLPLDDFLKAYPNKHEFIRNSLLNATLNFQHRVKMFIKHIVMSKSSSLTVSYYNYRIEFQLRGAPHVHGTLWMDWKRFNALAKRDVDNIVKALNLIKSEERLSLKQKQSLAKFADLFISCSLKNPDTVDIVKEVNIHHHTAKACKKYGGNCRFRFPRFPIHKTIISAPSYMMYDDIEEREEKMKRYTLMINAVKEILDDDDIMKKVCTYKQGEMEALEKEAKEKCKISYIVQEADYRGDSICQVPEDLHQVLIDILDEEGKAKVEDLKTKIDSLNNCDEEIRMLIKKRIEHMLELVDIDITKYGDVSSKLEEYVDALSINKKGYSIVYKRDVNETMVNTYNPEWIAAWNGNIDIQLCLDFFAVITYISDYYSKDDSGTMPFLQEALKQSHNDDLRTKLRKVESVFLTHRQIGESEAYYRLLPSMHLKDSNIKAVFAPTGFNPSRFLEKIDEEMADQCENSVEVTGREGKYQEKPSMYDKYLRRDCKRQPQIKDLCYAQFVKRYFSTSSISKSYNFEEKTVNKTTDEDGTSLFKENIITKDYDDKDQVYKLPKYISITNPKVGEPSYMKLKCEQVLRFHKFKRDKNLHEHLFSELQLYRPHTNNKKDGLKYNLKKEREDLDICQETFQASEINKVKNKVMEFLESVEEGVEAAQELMKSTIGDELDPQNEQDKAECEGEEIEYNPDFVAKDPSEFYGEMETPASTGMFKKVDINCEEELATLTYQLDQQQRMVLDIGVNYAKQMLISRKTPIKVTAPLLIIQGGAGSGKSTVINVLAQRFEKLMRQSGDDLEKPYVLKVSFTGTAAANIDGMTLHSAFNFNFGNEYQSLGDKTRDEKRAMLENLKMIIVDELSMVKGDMFYQLDLRLRELKEVPNQPFGGCAVFLFGDILQLRPVKGKYIFQKPACEQYHISHTLDPLWHKFQVVLLVQNHRQGEDRPYADVLNRIRVGEQTEDDYKMLEKRVRKKGDHDLPKNALYITCKNVLVNEINEKKLEEVEGTMYTIEAKVRSAAQKTRKPRLNKDGSILNTPLQNILKLKTTAKVMLTYNVDVMDSLANGAIGEVVGFLFAPSGEVKTVLVHFKNEKVGRNKRKNTVSIQRMFPKIPVTPIEKIEFRFSLSKNTSSNNAIMTATQFPLKLSFACTAHKMQGSTVAKPEPLILDIRSVMEAAQGYVMLSRVQSANQLYIIEEVPRKKIYPCPVAVEELQRLVKVAINKKEESVRKNMIVTSLNIRSLPKHHPDLSNDFKIKMSKVIALQETWCSPIADNSHLELPGYSLHLISQGPGKGIATYYQGEFKVTGEVNKNKFQMARISGNKFEVINIYRSQGADTTEFIESLTNLIMINKNCYIVGDFNIDYLTTDSHPIIQKIISLGFEPLVHSATHSEGSLLDHAYVRSPNQSDNASLYFPYYSDHAAVSINSQSMI